MVRRRTRAMIPRMFMVVVALAVAALSGVAEAFKDPHNKFCGDDECYALLGLQRGADKADIKKAYRTISLEVHPDKNPTAEAKEKFTKVAKAYGVFMDEELNQKYHFFLDHPDAYWLEYGHHWVMRYASASDVRVVLLGLLILISFFAYGIQHTRYTTAVRYLRKAAERNLGPKSGGNAATMQLRREAEALLAERKGETQGSKKNGVGSKGSKVKQSRKEKEAELAEVIAELALQVEIKGSCRKPSWRDQPVVLLAMLPMHTATYLWHKFQLIVSRITKREVAASEREYWARRAVGSSTWEDLDEGARAAATVGDAWRGGEALGEWKEVYLFGGGMSSGGVRKRKKASPVANGNMMKGVLGEGPEVEY
eukprot:g1805.t1